MQILFFLKLTHNFAPTGYPLISPIIKAKLPSPDILKRGFIILLKIFPKNFGMFVLDSSSVAIKKGNREGTTELAHSFKPDLAACRLEEENTTKQAVKSKTMIEIKFFLILITKIFIFFIWTPLYILMEK